MQVLRMESSVETGKFISYLRVSTQRQGKSGLGLEAQREAVSVFLNGGGWKLVEEVLEIESGKRNDRPELTRALSLCRIHGARLLVAKLDRLARNVAFISTLMESGVEFEAVDLPQANKLTVHIMAAMAEHEAKVRTERAKKRTKDLVPVIDAIRAAGARSLRQIAAALNEKRIPTARGGDWSAVQVQRLLTRT